MGTDITLYAEKRSKEDDRQGTGNREPGNWEPVPEPALEKRTRKGKRKSGVARPQQALNDMGRPYPLFSLLSGRGVGLLADMSSQLPIFEPRGFPDDMSQCYKKWLPKYYDKENDWGLSWLNLEELIQLNWETPIRSFAYAKLKHAELFDPDQSFPKAFPANENLYHGKFREPPKGTCKVEWSESLREYVGCSEWFIKSLSKLGPESEIRIIYWFDS